MVERSGFHAHPPNQGRHDMTLWRMAIILTGASLLVACGSRMYILVPSDADGGRLDHDIYGPGQLSVTYAGKTYSGDFETTGSHCIHGRHRIHRGWIVDVQLTAKDRTHLHCHLEWPYAGNPSGTCQTPTGKSFAVRFE
jgi:hypothetical protein